ncbi:MAG: NAD-dependent succinate-semialdehyde dehydrogenase [Leptospirales bacterium]
MKLESINPATEERIETFEPVNRKEIINKIEKGHHAYMEWRLLYLYTRAKYLKKTAIILREQKEDLAKLITLEVGKPIAQSLAEVEKCAVLADYYATNGPIFLEDKEIKTEASKSYVTIQPLGTILGIMPWNFPLWQVFRFALPVIMVGNSVLLKHAPNVMKCAMAIEKVFIDAGYPEGVFQNLPISVDQVPFILENDFVQGVSLTGSEKAGKAVAELAGRNLKPSVLELGGSDPYIVFQDADLEQTVESCVNSRLLNCGQSCISAKRFIVDEKIYPAFMEMFIEKMKSKQMGAPDGEVDLGPMARKDLRDHIHIQVERTVQEGAKLELGGKIPNKKGFYYPATILSGVKPGMTAWEEETFGPVAAVTSFSTELEAVRLAALTNYGLGAALFSKDIDRMEKLARYKIQAGSVFMNDFVKSDPRLPFGGIKSSGFGRELSEYGMLEFANVKTVYIK